MRAFPVFCKMFAYLFENYTSQMEGQGRFNKSGKDNTSRTINLKNFGFTDLQQ